MFSIWIKFELKKSLAFELFLYKQLRQRKVQYGPSPHPESGSWLMTLQILSFKLKMISYEKAWPQCMNRSKNLIVHLLLPSFYSSFTRPWQLSPTHPPLRWPEAHTLRFEHGARSCFIEHKKGVTVKERKFSKNIEHAREPTRLKCAASRGLLLWILNRDSASR